MISDFPLMAMASYITVTHHSNDMLVLKPQPNTYHE